MNGISGEAPKGGGGAGFVAVMEKIGMGASSFLRRIMPRFFYVADWDVGRLYGFARRCGGISRRVRVP